MRVLVVTLSYPSGRDPTAGIFVQEHALAAAEHAEVSVLHLARGESPAIRRLAGEPLPTWRAGFPERGAAAGLAAAAVRGLRSAPRRDLVHAHFFPAAAPVALLSSKPLVLTEHWSVFLPEDPLRLTRSLAAAARVAFARARLVLPVSRTLERAILGFAPRTRTRVVPNAVDTSIFHPGGEPALDRLLAVGLLYPAKGFDRLLDALPAILAARPSVQLDLVGDGELRTELERRAAGLPVMFHGRISKPEVAALMRRAQLLVAPSRFETSGVVALEALATGLPVVGTNVPALGEAVREDDGVLAPPDRLADAVVEALGRSFDRAAIAERARERFGRARIGAELAEVYATAVGGGSLP